jgi:L-ribulokinase
MTTETTTILEVRSSPHLHGPLSVDKIMRNVVYALLPLAAFAIWNFGLSAALLLSITTATCILTEHAGCRLSGNRSTVNDWSAAITGLLLGQTLYTTQSEIYRALIEATAFGARAILERLQEYGVPVDRIVCAGGIAEKNPLLMQIYADITGCTMQVSGSSQACALGSAIAAAVLAGAYQDFHDAQKKMTSVQAKSYRPIAANRKVYNQLYTLYRTTHDAFGGVNKSSDLSRVMKDLLALKSAAHA